LADTPDEELQKQRKELQKRVTKAKKIMWEWRNI
jgi:hypothetical protein